METRAIQKTGGSSYSFILPKKWVNLLELSDENELDCYIYPKGHLIISPHSVTGESKASINIDNLSINHLGREIIGLYISGSDNICISSKGISSNQRSFIRELSHKFIGFEIYESSSTEIILKNVSKSSFNIPESIERMLSILLEMYKDLILALQNSDRALSKDIIERDVEVDRIHLYIKRFYLSHLNSLTPDELYNTHFLDLDYYDIAGVRLERITDHVVVMARTIQLLRPKENISLSFVETKNIKDINLYLNLLHDIIIKKDKKEAHKLLDLYEKNDKNIFTSKSIRSKNPINLIITDRVDRIRSYCANIAEETINYSNTENTNNIK